MYNAKINNQKTIKETVQMLFTSLITLGVFLLLKIIPVEFHASVEAIVSLVSGALFKILWVRIANWLKHKDE